MRSVQVSRFTFNHKEYYFNGIRYLHLKVCLPEVSFEKTLRLFSDSNNRRKCILHMTMFLLLTADNLLLTIGIAGKEGTTSLSAEQLLYLLT